MGMKTDRLMRGAANIAGSIAIGFGLLGIVYKLLGSFDTAEVSMMVSLTVLFGGFIPLTIVALCYSLWEIHLINNKIRHHKRMIHCIERQEREERDEPGKYKGRYTIRGK